MADDYISASEIGEYLYCRRAWWFRRQGIPSANQPVMDEGTEEHDRFGRRLTRLATLRKLAWRLLIAGVVILVILIVFRLRQGG